MENKLHNPLTEPQLDLLRMFAHQVDDADWVAIKRMIINYFAQKAIGGADAIWDEQDWSDQQVIKLLGTHLRTPYKGANS